MRTRTECPAQPVAKPDRLVRRVGNDSNSQTMETTGVDAPTLGLNDIPRFGQRFSFTVQSTAWQMSGGHFELHGEEGQCFMIGTTTQRENPPFTAFCSKLLARFGNAPYTFARRA